MQFASVFYSFENARLSSKNIILIIIIIIIFIFFEVLILKKTKNNYFNIFLKNTMCPHIQTLSLYHTDHLYWKVIQGKNFLVKWPNGPQLRQRKRNNFGAMNLAREVKYIDRPIMETEDEIFI